jgi:hypothetical protein
MLRSAYPPGGGPPDFPETPQGACGRGQPPERAAEQAAVLTLVYQALDGAG